MINQRSLFRKRLSVAIRAPTFRRRIVALNC